MPPAARSFDATMCVMHGAGLILPTPVSNVVVENQAPARIADPTQCPGASEFIAYGSPTVVIVGLYAARLGDPLNHGGKIASGAPTVLIGIPGQGAALSAAAASGAGFVADCEDS